MSDLTDLVSDVVEDAPPDLWAALETLGLTTIGVPEDIGGSGGSLDDLAEVVGALAAAGRPTPVAEHATAARALAATPLRPRLVTIAHRASTATDGDLRLVVPWASHASHVMVVPLGEGPVLVADTTAPELVITPGTDVAGAPLDQVDAPVAAFRTVPDLPARDVLARLSVLRAVALTAAAGAAYDLTRSHVRTREQFGRPLVRIPAVATDLARLRVETIQGRTAVATALERADDPGAYYTAVAARVVCSRLATEAARIAHQLHGALGITLEYGLHPLTRLLWALHDADAPEDHWAVELGRAVVDGGEAVLWDDLTALAAAPS